MEDQNNIRVLVVDDSITVRKTVIGILKKTPDIAIAGEAENGKDAIEKARRLTPDVILMDLVMPVMSGLAAVEYIMSHMPLPIVIHSSFIDQAESDKTRDAAIAGALAALDKADAGLDHAKWEKNLVRTIRAASRIRVKKKEITFPSSEITTSNQKRVDSKSSGIGSDERIRVLVVDDSLTVRKSIVEILERTPDTVTAGEARNGREAIDLARNLKPDVILMDLAMPVMSGLAAVEYIMSHMPVPIVINSAFRDKMESRKTLDAAMAGALTALDKTAAAKDPGKWEKDLLQAIRAASRVKLTRRIQIGAMPAKRISVQKKGVFEYDVVAFGVSFGGPAIIAGILNNLPPNFKLPILLVIHISRSEESIFAEWLNDNCVFDVMAARDGLHLSKLGGQVLVAPINKHMTVRNNRIRIIDSPSVNFCKPSVDELFHSLAREKGPRPIAALLTGMGHDGAQGLKAIRDNGGYTICQDETTSVIFGMPKAGIDIGAADTVLPDYLIADRIMDLAGYSGKTR